MLQTHILVLLSKLLICAVVNKEACYGLIIGLMSSCRLWSQSTAVGSIYPHVNHLRKWRQNCKGCVISRIDEPTVVWCAPMVVAPKDNGAVMTCVNQSVHWERHPLFQQLSRSWHKSQAKRFRKLDANSGCWQIPLAKHHLEGFTLIISPLE